MRRAVLAAVAEWHPTASGQQETKKKSGKEARSKRVGTGISFRFLDLLRWDRTHSHTHSQSQSHLAHGQESKGRDDHCANDTPKDAAEASSGQRQGGKPLPRYQRQSTKGPVTSASTRCKQAPAHSLHRTLQGAHGWTCKSQQEDSLRLVHATTLGHKMDTVGSKASVQVALVGTAVLAMVAMVWVLVVKVAEMGRCTRCRSLDQSTRPVGPQRSCPRRSCTIGCLCGTETNTLRAGYCRHRTG